MDKVVGIIYKINGNIVKKDIIKGTEENLKNGDLIMLDDSVWLRSLDAYADVILCKTKVPLKAGMRIKFDHNYLQKMGSDKFFSTNDIRQIRSKIKIKDPNEQTAKQSPNLSSNHNEKYKFEIIKNLNVNIKNTDIVNLQIDNMIKNSTLFDTNIIMYDNSNNPSFKFNIDSKIIPKIFILGFEDYVLEEPKELNGLIHYGKDGCIFVSSSSFVISGTYVLYVRFTSLDEPNLIKEVFFKLAIKFDNEDIPKIQNITEYEIYGFVSEPNSEVVLYEHEINGSFNKLISTYAAASGKFIINLNKFKNTELKSVRLCIRSVDIYGNATAAVAVQI